MLRTLAIANYRSLRRLVLPLGRLNVVTGANGSGKSSLYRALRLLSETAHGGVVRSLAREGGLSSVLWAGPESVSAAMRRGDVPVQGTARRREPVHLRLGFGCDADDGFGYAIDIGLPTPPVSPWFVHDPEIKSEVVFAGPAPRPASQLTRRQGASVQVRADRGWRQAGAPVPAWASMLSEFADPQSAPELLQVRDQVRRWRFHDHFRSDEAAPARQPQVGTRTPVLGHDGADLASAVATLREIGDAAAFDEAIADAFPGCSVDIEARHGQLEVQMRQPGLLRPLRAAELSEGTLRFVLLATALLSPRPAPLLVLNEPEASLHPDLLPALGRLVARAARDSQLVVVTHSGRLAAAIEAEDPDDLRRIELRKEHGETLVAGDGEPVSWEWPGR
jgi:predicted ATPase